MCLLCLEWEKGKMTSEETYSAIGEMLSTEENEEKVIHLLELSNKILDKETPYGDWNEELHGHYIEGLDYEPSTED